MPDLVRWEHGIRVAPYMRSLKQHRPVVVVLADRQRARILVYRNGEVTEPEDLLADTSMGDLTDVSTNKRAYQLRVQAGEGTRGTTSGVRGETATDQAQRILEVSSERMWKALGLAAASYAGADGFLVLGGPSETAARLSSYLPEPVRARATEGASLHLGMTTAEIRTAAEEAAHALSAAHHESLVGEVVDRARSGGKAVLGGEATARALREMRVDTLLLSASFLRSDPDFADHCAGAALSQHAQVEEIGSPGGERLDQEGGGIGARLRYRIDGEGD
jgi:peptide subunit release factor 1 (eRF1)